MKLHDPICIVPARGGSKRLPRKNILEIGGKTVIEWTLLQAIESGLFFQVIVSTEDQEIANVANRVEGVSVWQRDEDLAGDLSTVDQVCQNVLDKYNDENGVYPESFCCLYATAVLRSTEDIIACYEKLRASSADSVITVTEYEQYPHQALKLEESGAIDVQWPELLHTPRQQRPHLVVDAGSVYWFKTKAFLVNKNTYSNNMQSYIVPRDRAIDLDTPADVDLMRFYWNKRQGE